MPPTPTSVRLDKWLWATRIYKTRSLAAEACRKGMVQIGDQPAKPSRDVRVGEILFAHNEVFTRTVRVLALVENRVSAALVKNYIEDLTPQEELLKRESKRVAAPIFRPAGAGRPTKKDRRQLRQVFGLDD
jgi:ribosome-associated heat shock protein Hsp15